MTWPRRSSRTHPSRPPCSASPKLAQALAPQAEAVSLILLDDRGRPDLVVSTGEPTGEAGREGRHPMSLPLVVGGSVRGTITWHADDGATFSETDRTDASVFAAPAAAVLVNAQTYWDLVEVAAGLEEAMQSRAVIEQAKGKLMATEGCTADEAFEHLARASQRENVKLRVLARRIVDGASD